MQRFNNSVGRFCATALLAYATVGMAQDVPEKMDRDSLLASAAKKEAQVEASFKQGDLKKTSELLDDLLRIKVSLHGQAHEELIETLNDQALVASQREDFSRAIAICKRAYKIGQQLYPKGDYRIGDLELALQEATDHRNRTPRQRAKLAQSNALNQQISALFQQGRPAETINLGKEMVQLNREVLGNQHPQYAQAVNTLGELYYSLGQVDSARASFQEACDIWRRSLGANHPNYAKSLGNLAETFRLAGEFNRALSLQQEAAAIAKQALGKTHPQYATIAGNLALLYQQTGDLTRAEPLLIEVKNIRESENGKASPEYAMSANNLAMLYQWMGQFRKAEPLFKEAADVQEAAHGRKHPWFAQFLNNLGQLYSLMGDHRRAEPLLVEAKAIREELLGKQNPAYAVSVNNLAELYRIKGDYAQAEPLYIEALAIIESQRGNKGPDYAFLLNNLAILYETMGDYAQAETRYLDVREIKKEVYGKSHSEYALSLNNLASVYAAMGRYQLVEILYKEATSIYEKAVGKDHVDYALSLNNLAWLYATTGRLAEAEPLYRQALAIREKVEGKEHPNYAASLGNLAGLYSDMGDLNRAASLYQESMAIMKKVYGPDHPKYAQSLDNLSAIYQRMGKLVQSESMTRQAAEIDKKRLGPKHPNYAIRLNGLAVLYQSMGRFEDAESLFKKVIEIRKDTLTKDHPHYAMGLNNLAQLYGAMGDYARAEPLCEEARAINETFLGKDHPDYAGSLNDLATICAFNKDFQRAQSLYLEAIDIMLRHLESTASIQSEAQQIRMNHFVRYYLDNYIKCCLEGDLNPQQAIGTIVRWKGSILRRARDIRLIVDEPEIREQFRQLQSLSGRLARVWRSIPSSENSDLWRTRFATLSEEKERLEADLSRRSDRFRQAMTPVGLEDIRRVIPSGAVLIDYLEYSRGSQRSIAASVIRRDGELALIDLGSAEVAGQAIDEWRKPFENKTRMTKKARDAGAALRRQLWQPLMDYVLEADLVLVSTDGVLGRMPLAALPAEKPDRYLIEEHRLTLIPVPQLLPALLERPQWRPNEGHVLLVGDVDYGESQRSRVWSQLDHTGLEIDFLKSLFLEVGQRKGTLRELRDQAATETAFRAAAPGCQLLHLATHGYFASAERTNALSAGNKRRSRGVLRTIPGVVRANRQPLGEVSPGQLSGLVFAGANRDEYTASPSSNSALQDDGIMTADEIAFLPLDQTGLVVLSACETGLGEAAGGEGLIGIQRGFQVSGADSVIATMWKVDDAMTRKLMERFYRNLLVDKKSRLDALREAQLWVLNHPSLLSASGDRGSVRPKLDPSAPTETPLRERTGPYYWAPFVLSGDWR